MNKYEDRHKFIVEVATKKMDEIFKEVKDKYEDKEGYWLTVNRIVALIFHLQYSLSISGAGINLNTNSEKELEESR